MYPQPVYENILYSELLNMLLEGWLDVTRLHWFATHFFDSPSFRCAFFNPQKITGSRCKKLHEDVKNVKEIRELHSKKVFYLAPYLARKHWSFIIVCPDFKFGYIVDSINEGKAHKSYKLVKIIEEVFEINFKWHMAQCKQQKGSWECGYMVNRLWNEEGYFEESQIENLVVDLMLGFIKKMF
ncbi:putative papain-like cysteine peptidase superfamily [Helianthus annuus]|nr:putative papain-like cysteine peptidase superfamily [Helianthus annuus]